MNGLKVFENKEFGKVRTLMIDGVPWFVGKDVAAALGYSNASKAVTNHVDDEDKQFKMFNISDSQNGNVPIGQSKTAIINESGVYALIFSSRLESAKKFKRWVTSKVLPELRETGHYEMPDIKSIYDRKATSVGEVVNLVRVQQKAMERRGCGQQDISEMMAETFEQFGIPVPQCFLAAPGWKNTGCRPEPDYEELLQILQKEAADMHTRPYCGGTAIPVQEFNSFCVIHGVRSNGFKKWLYENGYIAYGSRSDNMGVNFTVPVKMKGKNVRCVALF